MKKEKIINWFEKISILGMLMFGVCSLLALIVLLPTYPTHQELLLARILVKLMIIGGILGVFSVTGEMLLIN